MQRDSLLHSLQTSQSGLPVWTSSSDDFDALSQGYLHSDRPKPLAVVRPRNEDDVVAVVKYATSTSTPLAVRSGGHDHRGRSLAAGALVLDVRDLRDVTIVDDGKAAVIGGGISNMELAEVLGRTGHATAVGACGTVGYAGWAMHGGYGPFSGVFGLGVDQIVGARLVDGRGEVVDAGEELLYGIRGAGSAFGVVVSLKIKIYKLEKILAGAVAYAVGDAVDDAVEVVLRRYHELHEKGVPPELGLDIIVCNIPNLGKGLLCSFVWASDDIARGQEMVDKLAEVAPIAMNMVGESTPLKWLVAQQQNVPPAGSYANAGYMSFTLPKLDTDVRSLLAKYTKQLPANPATLWFEHRIHGAACKPSLPSCFAYREPHIMIEVLGTSATAEAAEASATWETSFHEEGRLLPQTYKGGYVPLVSPDISMEACYSGHWDRLQRLKAKVDPGNVFRYSLTGLGET